MRPGVLTNGYRAPSAIKQDAATVAEADNAQARTEINLF
jgi:hypothetical protein